MTSLEFIAHLVESLVWPITVIFIVLLLRRPLAMLLPQLQRVRYKDFEFDFDDGIDAVRADIASVIENKEPLMLLPTDDPLAKLAESSPRAAVLESWLAVEQAALKAARIIGMGEFTEHYLSENALKLLETQGVDSSVVGSLRELRALRNQAAHAPSFALSAGAARRYAISARAVEQYLRGFSAGA